VPDAAAAHFTCGSTRPTYRRDEQLATLAWFLERATDAAGRGRIEFLKMSSYVAGDEIGIEAGAAG
jgi:hypothetical protein